MQHVDRAGWGNIFSVKAIYRAVKLFFALAGIWFALMLLTGWYSAGFHVAATLSSMILVSTGNSWGVVERIVR